MSFAELPFSCVNSASPAVRVTSENVGAFGEVRVESTVVSSAAIASVDGAQPRAAQVPKQANATRGRLPSNRVASAKCRTALPIPRFSARSRVQVEVHAPLRAESCP